MLVSECEQLFNPFPHLIYQSGCVHYFKVTQKIYVGRNDTIQSPIIDSIIELTKEPL